MLKLIVYFISISVLVVFCQDLRIIAPYSVFQIDLNTTSCQQGETKQILSFSFNSITFAAVNQGFCGFTVYNLKNTNDPKPIFSDLIPMQQCTSFFYLSSQQLLIVGFSNGIINTYYMNSNSVFQMKSNFLLPNSEVIYYMKNNIQIPNSIFFFALDSVSLIQINQASELQQQQRITQSFTNKVQIDILGNNEYIFATTQNQGIQMTKLIASNNNNQVSYSLGNICYLNPLIYTVLSFQMLTSNIIVMMQSVLGIYVYDIGAYFNSQGSNCQFTKLYSLPFATLGNQVLLSADKKYLYASYKSVGIYIYQINQSSATLVQTIWQIGSGYHILCENESILLTTNSRSFLGYQATLPNLNNIVPNLLLNYQQMQVVPTIKKPGIDRDCIYNESTRLLFMISPSYSLVVFQYQGNGIFEKLFIQLYSGQRYIMYAMMLKDDKTVIAITKSNGISIMDFSNPSQPVYVQEGITFGIPQISLFFMEISDDEQLLAVVDNSRAIFVNISNPYNPQLISIFDITTIGAFTPLSRMVFSFDYKVIYLGTASNSLITVDISNISTPVFLSKLDVEGLFQLRATKDGKNIIFTSLQQGLVNIDVTDPKNMKIVSSTTVIGVPLSAQLINNDQFILITSTGNPSIKLIDYRNRTNPQDYQLFQLQSRKYNFIQICKTNHDQNIFISSESNIISLNLKNTLNLHTQIYSIQQSATSNEQQLTILEPTKPLLVGQNIQMSFMNVIDSAQLSITDAFYYTSNTIQSLPSWIVFSQISNYLLLKITKESITSNSSQQIVLKVLRQILDTAFENNYLQLGSAQSLILKNSCIKLRYIDSSSYVSQQFDSQGYFVLDPIDLNQITTDQNQQQKITTFVFFTLKSNIVYYTIPIVIQPSLVINFSNKNSPIQSNQNSISVYLTCVDPTQGQFVNQNYPSVLVMYSDQFNQIKLEGTLDSINRLLSEKVKFHNTTDSSHILISVQVQDGVNFDFFQSYLITDLQIIDLQQQVMIEQSKSLQDYFNDKYSLSQLVINSYFSFQIPRNHYISYKNYPLTYTVYELSQKEYRVLSSIYKNGNITNFNDQSKVSPLSSSSWIQFSTADQVITGMPSPSNLFNQYYLMVNVTDGYTFLLEPLMVDVNQVPFGYVIQLIIQIGGPLIGILGLWKFKYLFFNTFFLENYLYSPETITVGQVYQKQIYLYGESLPQAVELCQKFLPKFLTHKFIEQQVFALLQQQQQQQTSEQEQQQQQQQNRSQLMDTLIYPQHITEYYNQTINQQRIPDTSGANQIIISSSIQNSQIHKIQRQNSNEKKNKLENSFFLNETKKLRRKLKQLSTRDVKDSSVNLFQLSLFESTGKLNIPFIMQHLLNMLTSAKIYKNKGGLIADINNPKSAMYKIISGLAIIYIKDNMKASNYIFKHMKALSIAKYNKKDWYRLYVNIEELQIPFDSESVCFFSKFKINNEKFNKDFEDSLSFIENIRSEKIAENELCQTLSTFSIIIQLVQGSMIAAAQGISFDKRGITFRGFGESINCDQHFIKTIKGYQKSQTQQKSFFGKCNRNYKEKFLISNQMIPSWIKKVELVNNIIIIEGTPEKQHIGTTLLTLLDESNIIQFAFEIEVRAQEEFASSLRSENILISEQASATLVNRKLKQNYICSSQMYSEHQEQPKSPLDNLLNRYSIDKSLKQLAFSPKYFNTKTKKSQIDLKY